MIINTKLRLSKTVHYMALIVSTSSRSSLKLINHQSSLICLASKTNRQSAISCIKPKLATSKTKTFTCKYKNSTNNTYTLHDEKRSERRRTRSSANPVPETESYSHRIWWSDVEVKWPKKMFVGRKWSLEDIESFSAWLIMHGLALFAPFTFSWGAFWVAVVLYFVTGMLGMCLSYHRHLTHKSFKLKYKWLEYFFAYCGVLAFQGDPIFWVSTHRHHHQFVDSEQDIHSPTAGFWFSHINWMFDSIAIDDKCGKPNNAQDLVNQPFYRFIKRTYPLHTLLLGVLLYALGGFPYLVWGMGARTIWFYHMLGLVNSVCHTWGKQAWNTGDLSKNNWFVAMVTFGEGWHNNHHAFGYSARHGLEWWQIDMTWYTIKLLQLLGLATHVKLPTHDHKHLLSIESDRVAT